MAHETITIRIKDGISPRLDKLIETLGSRHFQERITRAVGNTIKAHLILINGQRPNALGGKRTDFYAKAARSIDMIITEDHGQIVIKQRGFRYQLKGGTIRPSGRLSAVTGKPIRHLVIPIHKEAHGHTPSDGKFAGKLFLLRSKSGSPTAGRNQALLARAKGRGKQQELEFIYVLKTSVSKKPDPTLLPTKADINAAVHSELERLLNKETRHG